MRARAAYISSVGTTTILVAAAIFMLGVVSALVAFRGWPGNGTGDGVTSVPLDVPPRAELVRKVRSAPSVTRTRAVGAATRTVGRRAATRGLVKVSMRRPDRVGLLMDSPPPGAAPAPAPAPPPAQRPEPPAPPETPDPPASPVPVPALEPVVDGIVESAPPISLPVAGVEVPLP